jgi:hypothetical protein
MQHRHISVRYKADAFYANNWLENDFPQLIFSILLWVSIVLLIKFNRVDSIVGIYFDHLSM